MSGIKTKLATVFVGLFLALSAAGPLLAKDRLTIDLVNEPTSLDPHVQWNPDSYSVYRNIFDNLITRNDKGEIVAEIATSWKQVSDTVVEFQIRGDVTFHDGQKLTPEDVVYSVRRITDPKFGSPQLSQFNKISKAEVVGSSTVRITTDGPYPALLAQLVKLSIVPKSVVEAVGKDAFNLKPVGSGPYSFQNWQRGVQVTLARNEKYWGAKGPFPSVVFRAVPDAATRVANLQAGASDLAVTLNSDLAAQFKSSPKVKVLSVLSERVAYLAMNVQKAPLDDVKIRQAVAYAIDKQGLVDGILGGYDKPVSQLLTSAHTGWGDGIQGLPYDLAKAKAIVAAAGPKAKQPISLLTAAVYDQRVVQALQQMMVEAGLSVKIEMTDFANWLKQMQSGPDSIPQMAFSRWSCACQDADGIMFPILHSSSGWANARDAEMDRLLAEARLTIDGKKRVDLYRQASERLAKELFVVPIYQVGIIYGAAKGLQWQPTPNESMFLNRMSWKD